MNKNVSIAITAALVMNGGIVNAQEATNIGKHNITLSKDVMTPETFLFIILVIYFYLGSAFCVLILPVVFVASPE